MGPDGGRRNRTERIDDGRRESDDGPVTLCLDVEDLAAVLADVGVESFMDELIDDLRHAFSSFDRKQVEDQVRAGFSYRTPATGLVEWMPCMDVGRTVAVKTVGYHPDNPRTVGLPSVLATISLYDTATGRLEALCEGTVLTAFRTGAASAVMTDALAAPGPITLGVVGCGAQSVTQIMAIARVRPIERLMVTDIDRAVAESLHSRLPAGTLGPDRAPEVVDGPGFEALVPELDVLCTCTSVEIDRGPVLELRDAKPGLHVNAVGSDFPGKVEIPVEYLRGAVVVPDVIGQCLVEGESQQLEQDELGPDMTLVLTDPANRELVNRRTVFDSTGWSYEDLVAARLFIRHADRLGRGTRLGVQHRPSDPYDPLEIVRPRPSG